MNLEERLDSLALNLELLQRDVDLVKAKLRRRSERLAWLRVCSRELFEGAAHLHEDSFSLRGATDSTRVRVELMRSSKAAEICGAREAPRTTKLLP